MVAQPSQDFSTHFDDIPQIGNLFADAMRDAAHTDIAIDSGQMYTDLLEAGPVTVRDVYNLAPHVYSWSSKGWHIYRCQTKNLTLKLALSILGASQLALGVSGMDMKLGPMGLVTGITVNGQPIELNKSYSLALSEGFAYAAFTRPRIEEMLCSNLTDTGILVRDALLTKFEAVGNITPQTLGPLRIHHVPDTNDPFYAPPNCAMNSHHDSVPLSRRPGERSQIENFLRWRQSRLGR